MENLEFKELSELSLNTVDELHALFPHWKRASVQRKLSATMEGKDKRFVALKDGKIVAHIKVVFGKDRYAHAVRLNSVVVLPPLRRNGIAYDLTKFVIATLPKKIKLATLVVGSKNKPAINLYKKLEFKKYGLLKNAAMVNGKSVNELLMCKELN